MLMISSKLSLATKPRHDINGNDSVQTVWVELMNHNLIIGGVYRRARPSPDLEKAEFAQLSNQILKATGKKILLIIVNQTKQSEMLYLQNVIFKQEKSHGQLLRTTKWHICI